MEDVKFRIMVALFIEFLNVCQLKGYKSVLMIYIQPIPEVRDFYCKNPDEIKR